MEVILAINRCIELLSSELARKFFGGWKIILLKKWFYLTLWV